MASSLQFIVLLCLTSRLWTGANINQPLCCCSDGRVADPTICKPCPDGWTKFYCYCFLYHHGEKAWADAEHTCISLGGNLASIPSTFRGSYGFIKSIIRRVTNEDRPAWLGGYDATKGTRFNRIDGTKFDFDMWRYQQPNNTNGEEHCLEMNYLGFANDANCLNKKSFVCGLNLGGSLPRDDVTPLLMMSLPPRSQASMTSH
ncbi:hypothetical protein L3Q82_016255, partial [Scortum barcoo]